MAKKIARKAGRPDTLSVREEFDEALDNLIDCAEWATQDAVGYGLGPAIARLEVAREMLERSLRRGGR